MKRIALLARVTPSEVEEFFIKMKEYLNGILIVDREREKCNGNYYYVNAAAASKITITILKRASS